MENTALAPGKDAAMVTASDMQDTSHPSGLTDEARGVLDFEREWWRYAGAKEQAIKEHFGLSTTSYYATLNALIDDDLAVEYDPMLVKRLRRMRSQRQRQRAARRDGEAH